VRRLQDHQPKPAPEPRLRRDCAAAAPRLHRACTAAARSSRRLLRQPQSS